MKNKYFLYITCLLFIIGVLTGIVNNRNNEITQLEAVIEEKFQMDKPEITEGNWTFFQYQYGCTNVFYSTQHWYEGNKIFIRDRETGLIFPIAFDDNVTPVPS